VTIAPDQLSMVLRIVDKEKFKRARLFVVAVED
jgi:hypothetical protein